MSSDHALEVAAGTRFEFGKNWSRFLGSLNEARIASAVESLQQMLGVDTLQGKTFLDAGSGSGLFSLAARRLGATVRSFDFDPQSVACTCTLKDRFFPNDSGWRIDTGSVIDAAFMSGLGEFDIVYSWGVLHHTGAMWKGIDLAADRVRPGGLLFVALYNDQGAISRYWTSVKALYNRSALLRPVITAVHFPYLYGARFGVRLLTGRLNLERGMSLWYDMLDWLGGFPFEVVSRSQIVEAMQARGFAVRKLVSCGRRHGCNEFVLERQADAPRPD